MGPGVRSNHLSGTRSGWGTCLSRITVGELWAPKSCAAGSALCSWLFGYLAVRSGGEVVDPSESMEPPVAAFG
ncbi:hypothetical protein GW17_00005654 [Ensete ventricosum]|nr:hypothetical protein GW17_00005654 [Ensete ventricosum]